MQGSNQNNLNDNKTMMTAMQTTPVQTEQLFPNQAFLLRNSSLYITREIKTPTNPVIRPGMEKIDSTMVCTV